MTTILQGLSESEVLARRQSGRGNNVEFQTSRSYSDIVRHNIFNFFNIILFSVGAVLVLLGRPGDAVFSTVLVVLNAVIGTVQEIRAKRKLDELALLTRPQVAVLRDGQEKLVDPSELVEGDLLFIRPGDQMVVDGEIVGDGQVEMDESLLTGESDLILKQAGDRIFSGSFCVTGTAMYQARQVGAESFANKLTAAARQFQISQTPLQKQVYFIIRLLMLVALFFGFLLVVSGFIYETPLVLSAQAAAVIISIVPNGLFFMIIVAYSLGAMRLAGQGTLVQQANAIEALSHVDVLCTDKTGTLTANRINFHDVYPLNLDKETLKQVLADFARSASVTNKTGEAIFTALGGRQRTAVDEVPFASARKWSALTFADDDLRGAYVLGAAEMLRPYLTADDGLSAQLQAWSEEGLRVLLFAYNPNVTTLHDEQDEPSLPPLTPLGLVSFSDELRPYVKETIAGFSQAGIRLKVISGDSPATVAALARQAGLPGDLKAVSGPELDKMDDAQFAQVAHEAVVFGRVTPEQKEKLVDALRRQKQYVAMIGDGVNDVLSLKKADIGIAMQSGSSAARGVADLILLNDSFTALLPAFLEGQRIVHGMEDILRLFLSRTFSTAMLIAAVAMMAVGFPTTPAHNALFSLLVVGVPTFFLALWASPRRPRQNLLQAVLPFAIPAAALVMVFGLLIYTAFYFGMFREILPVQVTQEQLTAFETFRGYPVSTGYQLKEEIAGLVARTALTVFSIITGLLLVLFVAPPHRFFVAGKALSHDKRPALVAVGLLVLFAVILAVDPLRNMFELVQLRTIDYLAIIAASVVWFFTLRFVWRARLLERFLGLDVEL